MTGAGGAQPARTRAAVLGYMDALNSHNADRIADCVAVDFENEHTSMLGTSVRGRQEYRSRLDDFFARFADVHYDVEDVIVDGDRAAVPYAMSCKAVGTDDAWHPVTIRGIFRFRVEGNELAHRIDYWDGMEFSRQLGGA